jgi:hypothetical protein
MVNCSFYKGVETNRMQAIATLTAVSKRGSKKVVRSARASKGWDVMLEACRWLMKGKPPKGIDWVVYPGIGTDQEHIDDRAIGSIFKSERTDEDEASRYLSRFAHDLDRMLQQTRDPGKRKKATPLDVQVYMGRPARWRVSIEFPLAFVFSRSGCIEEILEIVDGRFWGLPGEAYWTERDDGAIVCAEFSHKDDLGYIYFLLQSPEGCQHFQGEYPLIQAIEQIQPLRSKWFPGHGHEKDTHQDDDKS